MAEGARFEVYKMIYAAVEKFLTEFYTVGEHVDVAACEAATNFLMTLNGPGSPVSAERPWAVLNWFEEEDPLEPIFWAVVVYEWASFDSIPHEEFAAAFDFHICPPVNLPDEVQFPVMIYRGQSADDPKGLSWTLNRSVAEAFARGHRGIPLHNPVVLEMQVEFEQIAFYTNDRNEEEVVLWAIPD